MRRADISSLALILAAGLAVSPAAAQTASNLNALQLLVPFSTLLNTSAGQATLTANYDVTGGINAGTSGQPFLTSFAQTQQQALKDAAITSPNAYQLADGLGTKLGGAYQSLTSYTAPSGSVVATATGISKTLTNFIVYSYSLSQSDSGMGKYFFANGALTSGGATSATATDYMTAVGGTTDIFTKAYGVTGAYGTDIYGNSRPFQTLKSVTIFDGVDFFGNSMPSSDYLTKVQNLKNSPAWPSGHTTYGYTESLLLAMMVPERYKEMITRGAEYGNGRIVLGAHYALDVLGGRALTYYDMAQMLNNTSAYLNQSFTVNGYSNVVGYAAGEKASVSDAQAAFVSAQAELRNALATGCGATIASCAAQDSSRFATAATDKAFVAYTQTYGLPTLSYTAAPREAAPTGGPDASVLLATVYGGNSAAAKAIAPNGGLLGSLSTDTINTIIVNTESQALAAYYGTALSYWTRINLYDAAGYFSGVTGALTLASTDTVKTDVTVASGGALGGAGVIAGNLTYQSGSSLTTDTKSALTVKSGAVTLQNGATVALGNTLALPGTYKLVQADAGQAISLGSSVGVTGSVLSYEKASLAVKNSELDLKLTSNMAGLAQTHNQNAVASAIDASANASGFTDAGGLYKSLITGGATGSTFDALGGAGRAGATVAALQQGAGVADAISNQAAFGLMGSGPDTSGVSHVLSYAAEPKKGPIVVKGPAPAPARDWRMWGAFLGGGANIGADGGRPSYAGATYGGLAGLDYLIQPNWLLGVALGGGSSHYNTSLASSGDVSTFNAGLYTAALFANGYYVEGSETFAVNDNHGKRWVSGFGGLATQQLNASYGSWEARTRLEFGRAFNWWDYQVTPFIAGEIASLQSSAYTETTASGGASPFLLSAKAQTTLSAPLFLGFKLTGFTSLGNGISAVPSLSLAWVHEFSTDRNVNGQLIALPGADFTVAGPRAAANLAQVKAGVDLTNGGPLSVFAKFTGEFAPSVSYYGGQIGARYAF